MGSTILDEGFSFSRAHRLKKRVPGLDRRAALFGLDPCRRHDALPLVDLGLDVGGVLFGRVADGIRAAFDQRFTDGWIAYCLPQRRVDSFDDGPRYPGG